MVGTVVTNAFDKDKLFAGAVVLVVKGGKPLGISTIIHVNKDGQFVVQGEHFSGTIDDTMVLSTVDVKDDRGNCYPLKFSQWNKSFKAGEINNPMKPVEFILEPLKFLHGHYRRECFECGADFIASKRQPYCQNCCEANKIGKIILTKAKSKTANNIKPRTHGTDESNY
jgi:hypothetical protein